MQMQCMLGERDFLLLVTTGKRCRKPWGGGGGVGKFILNTGESVLGGGGRGRRQGK